MSERRPDESRIVDELKELGRHLNATVRAVAGSEQVRHLGRELRDGLREAAHNVEETLDQLRERDEVQRLRAQATEVAGAFRSGTAQQDIREEVGAALHALNERLRQLRERIQPDVADPDSTGSTAAPPNPEPYTGATRKLDT